MLRTALAIPSREHGWQRIMTGRRTALPWLVLLTMGASLAVYVVLHSPMRDSLAMSLLGRAARGSYFTSLASLTFTAGMGRLAALLVVIAAAGAAASIADRWKARTYEWPLAFGVLAFAFIVIPAAAAGGLAAALHTPLLRPPAGPLLVAAPALLVLGAALRTGWRPRLPAMERVGGVTTAVGAIALLLMSVSAMLSLLQPPTGFDALSYHGPVAVYLWRDGDIASFLNRAPSGFAQAWPASAELWFGLLLVAGGERLANIGQLPFALLGACAVNALARRMGARRASSTLAACAFLLAPIVVLQVGVQLNDLASAAVVLSGAALACASPREWSAGRAALVGLALGLAAATKLSVLPAIAAIVLFSFGRIFSGRHLQGARAWRTVCTYLVVLALAGAPWWIRNIVRYGNPIYPAAVPLLARGVVVGDFEQKDNWFVPARMAWPAYPLLEPLSDQSGYGALLIVGALPGVIVATTRRRRDPLVLFGLVVALSLPMWWLLTQHEPRHLLPVGAFAFAFLPAAFTLATRAARRPAEILVTCAALFTALATADQALFPRVNQQMERSRFYDVVWNVDPVVAGAAESEPLLYNTGYAALSYAGDYALLGPSLGRKLFTMDTGASTDDLVRTMRDARVRYAYVPASPSLRDTVAAKYSPAFFEVVHMSEVTSGDRAGTRRYLYRLREQVASR